MYDFLLYNLKTGACLAVFYLFYKVLLSRETFHRFNRFLLLAAVAVSFLLPVCVVTVYREVPLPIAGETLPAAAAVQPAALSATFPWERLGGVLFVAGAAAVLLWTGLSLLRVVRMVHSGRRMPLDEDAELVLHDYSLTPFSWMRYIVLSEEDYRENGEGIITHERAHVALRHSLDLLATDLLGCLQWFNPAMWLLRSELRAIHEYEADEAVLRSGVDARTYQMLLIRKAAGRRWCSVANSLNHSKLKNRITMMLRKKSSGWAGAKALFVLPLLGLGLGAFAETVYVFPEDKGTKKKETVQPDSSALSTLSALSTGPGQVRISSTVTSGSEAVQGPRKYIVRVTDSGSGEPLAGVAVIRKGSSQGAVTGVDGTTVLEVGEEGPVELTFTLVGYENLETTVCGSGAAVVSLDIALSRSDYETEEVAEVPHSGRPAPEAAVKEPLCLVNGEVVADPDAVDPADIASVTVYKDAETLAAYRALYGARAERGVIDITLRSKDGTPEVPEEPEEPAKVQQELSGILRIAGDRVTIQSNETGEATRITGQIEQIKLDRDKVSKCLIDGREASWDEVGELNAKDIRSVNLRPAEGSGSERVAVIETRRPKRTPAAYSNGTGSGREGR